MMGFLKLTAAIVTKGAYAVSFRISKRSIYCRWLALYALASLPFLVGLAGIALAAPTEKVQLITWKNLIPHVEIYNDPFLKLTPDQKLDLVVVSRTRQLQSEGVDITPEQAERLTNALTRLEKDHIDIDGLLALRGEIAAKRKHAMEAVNETLNEQQVRLAGYVLPLEMDGLKITEFLLVPYVGACIHEPVPPANQIVLVKFAQGIEVNGQFTPVWVQGKMITQDGTTKLYLIDGSADIPRSYTLEADAIELYKK
ncbi:DUF3299 domain-containing protein [Desulforhopalus sp. 52FAK]